MPVYILAGPAVALIGIVAVFFVMRHRSVQTKSMYSSRRSQIERKVRAARQRTLAPSGRGGKAPTQAEIAAAAAPSVTSPQDYQAPVYQAPPSSPPAWDMGASPAAQAAPAATPAYEPPAAPPYEPPSAPPAYEQPPIPLPDVPPPETSAEPVWNPAPSDAVWSPAPAADMPPAPTPVAEPAVEQAPEPLTPAGGGASWSIVGSEVPAGSEPERAAKAKDGKREREKQKEKRPGNAWELASGDAPGEEGEDDAAKRPGAAMALAQYAVLVVGLVMVLIGVLVMIGNSKVT